jgi:predicted kinase
LPLLLLISGLPGAGKTTLARAYASRYPVLHLNSDIVRAELDLRGHYTPEDKARVYAALLERAETALRSGQDVLIDSTFYTNNIRQPFIDLADRCGAELRWVEVRASEESIRERVSRPRPDSEADYDVYLKIRDASEPIEAAHLILWSDQEPLDALVEKIHQYLEYP